MIAAKTYWGKPERAPHRLVKRELLSISLSSIPLTVGHIWEAAAELSGTSDTAG